jgi:hypothetical protein
MKKNWMRLGLVLAMTGTLFTSGCWGLMLYGRPGPGRNQGKVDWGVVVLDLFFFGVIGIGVDACAGTLRRPEGERSVWSENKLRINVKPADLEKNGNRDMIITWAGNGESRELYAGTVRGASGREISTAGCVGGKIEVRLDGKSEVAWSSKVPGMKTRLAAQ